MAGILAAVLIIIAQWMIYKKMGREGWEGIIPFYNLYVLCDILYGKPWNFLLFLIPLYDIYYAFKLSIDFAKAFGRTPGFGVGMVFLPYIFYPILGFSDSAYGDGSSANTEKDILSKATDFIQNGTAPRHDDAAIEKLKNLSDLYDAGVITKEDFEEKKAELMKRL